MKTVRLLFAAASFVALSTAALAQSAISSSPRNPTMSDSAIVTYTPSRDVGKGNMTSVQTVYCYTTAKEPGASGWQDEKYRVAAWPDVGTIAKLQLARQTNGTHIFRIVPSVRAFYNNVPAGTNLDSLLFVFRSADGNTQGNDIVLGISRTTSVKEDVFSSTAHYPNPASDVVNISFGLKKAGNVTLKIFNAQGSEIATLLHNSPMPSNSINIASWNFENANGVKVPSGAYFYRLEVNGVTETGSVSIIR
jgi:hypothetical protein